MNWKDYSFWNYFKISKEWQTLLLPVPFFVFYILTQNHLWLKSFTFCICCLVPYKKLNYSFFTVAFQVIITLALLFLLLQFFNVFWLLVLLSTLAGAILPILISRDEKLRSLGSFIFIPSIYLAFEVHKEMVNEWLYLYLLAGAVPIFLLSFIKDRKVRAGDWTLEKIISIIYKNTQYNRKLILIFVITCFLATVIALVFNIPEAQWLIWSSQSVICITAEESWDKYKKRIIGAILGVTSGLFLGTILEGVLSESYLISGFIFTIILITLVLPVHYLITFTLRCMLITLYPIFCYVSLKKWYMLGVYRLENILLGGLIGILVFLLFEYLLRFFQKLKMQDSL